TFDRVSRKKATDCTPAGAKIELDVLKTIDPVTKKESFGNIPEGYNARADDDAHKCGEAASISGVAANGDKVSFTATPGGSFTIQLSGVTVTAGGTACSVTKSGTTYTADCGSKTGAVAITVTDTGYYS